MNVNICKYCHDKATHESCAARDTFIAVCQAYHDKGYRAAWLPPADEHSEFMINLLIRIELVERMGWIVTHETDQGYWIWPKYIHKARAFKRMREVLGAGWIPISEETIVFCIEGGHLGLESE